MTDASICLLLLYEKATRHVKSRLYGVTGEFGSELFSVSYTYEVMSFFLMCLDPQTKVGCKESKQMKPSLHTFQNTQTL